MTTEVNLIGMMKKAMHTHSEEEKKAIEVVTFSEAKDEEAKAGTKPPPRLVMAAVPPRKV